MLLRYDTRSTWDKIKIDKNLIEIKEFAIQRTQRRKYCKPYI